MENRCHYSFRIIVPLQIQTLEQKRHIIGHNSDNVTTVTLYNVCAVPWGCSVPWGVQYRGGILSTMGVFSTVGDIMINVGIS